MNRFILLLAAVFFCTHCTEAGAPVHQAADNKASNAPHTAMNPPAGPSASSAQKAHVDPDSGALTPRPDGPADPEISSLRQAPADTPDEDLKAQPSPVPGGGMMIDLKGKYRKPISATAAGDDAAIDRGEP